MNRFRNPWLRVASCAFLSLGICVLVGCSAASGNSGATVEGQVTFNGDPLPSGEVVFAVGSMTVSGQIQDGKFKAIGVPEGDAKVVVIGRPAGLPKTDQRIAAKMKESDMPGASASSVKIPTKYGK